MSELIEIIKNELLTCESVTDQMTEQIHWLIEDEDINWYPEVEELHKIYLFKCWHNVFTEDQLEIIYEKAYQKYHSYGLADIDCGFFELADFVDKVISSKHSVTR
jgi:hypothetical protein